MPIAAVHASGPPATMSRDGSSGQPSYPSEAVETSRKDSGFAESKGEQSGVHDSRRHRKASVNESTIARNRAVTPERRLSTEVYSQYTRRQGRPTASPSRSSSRDYQSSIPTASRATSRHADSLSRKSTGSYPTPRPSLIHSASSFHRPSSAYNKARPAMSIRTSSRPSTHNLAKDPLTFHHNSCRLFQSLGAHLAYHQRSPNACPTEGLTGTNDPLSRHGSIPAHLSAAATSDGLNSPSTDASTTKPTPPTIINWTSTSTRRREYEKIDKSHRSLRGWWRRVAPRWFPRPRSSRMGFYDGDSDAGSVRRYRIELPAEDDDSDDGEYRDMEKTASSVEVTETEKKATPASVNGQNSWSCFNFRDR